MKHFMLGVVVCSALAGCNQGYQSAAELERAERGPSHCAQSCHELGMRMSAFVLVESNVAGCVCAPREPAPPPPPAAPTGPVPNAALEDSSAAAAAGYVVLEARRRQAEEQQRVTPPKP